MSATAFTIRPVIVTAGKYRYERFQVCGWINQRRVRKVCETRDEALGLKNRLEVAALNAKRDPKLVMTRLTPAEVMDCEVALGRLKGVPLSSSVDWYLANYRPPVASKLLTDASAEFRESKKPHLSLVVQQCYKRTLRSLCEAFPGKDVADVGAAAVEGFMKAQNASLKRWNNLRGELHCFFEFCRADARRWTEHNPAKPLAKYKIPRGIPRIETPARIAELMAFVETYAGGPRQRAKPGCLVPYFALTTFAGIRPSIPHGEMWKLGNLKSLARVIDLDLGVIRIGPDVAKTRDVRQITIQPNLKAWLEAYPLKKYPIIVPGLQGMVTAVRKKFELTDDVLRHTFISMHVAAFGSVGRAALEAGNSERIIRRHYLNLVSAKEAAAFQEVLPRPACPAAFRQIQ